MGDISLHRPRVGAPAATERLQSEVESILSRYSHDEQRIILHNLEILASTSQFIGQDFQMKVLLNKPGEGWHWNFDKNEVRVDPETILKAPLDVSKAIYIHEGLHRRITPKDGVPQEEWREPGLPFLVNSIEDPRIENFGGEAYPAYIPIRDASYRHHMNDAGEAAESKLGRRPRHIQAGLELITQWFPNAANSRTVWRSTFAPLIQSAELENSRGLWLMPSLEGINSITVSVNPARDCESWPAKLIRRACDRFRELAARSTAPINGSDISIGGNFSTT